jgi:hypothetical protein
MVHLRDAVCDLALGVRMRIDDIAIKRSPLAGTPDWVLYVDMNGYKFTGYFGDFESFMQCFREMVAFYAFKAGKLNRAQAAESLTRPVQ